MENGAVILSLIFKFIMQNNTLGAHCEIALKWMPQNLTND